MKTIEEAIKKALEEKKEGWINAIRESDGFKEAIVTVWDDSTEEELKEEAEKEIKRLEKKCHWEISGFEVEID